VRSSDAQVRDVYVRRSRALDQVRAGIYQSAIVMRDFLLASDPDVAAAQAASWKDIRERTDNALRDGAGALDKAEQGPYSSLQAEVGVYWRLLDFITQMKEGDTRHRNSEYLSNELVRRRTAMLDLVDRIDQISTRQLHAGDQALDEAFRNLRVRLMLMLERRWAWVCCSRRSPSAGRCISKRNCRSGMRRACGAERITGSFGAAGFGAGRGKTGDFARAA